MKDNVTTFARWGGTEPADILTQALARTREEQRNGAKVSVVVGRCTQAADGTKFYDVFYSEINPDELLWLSKRIEIEAAEQDDEAVS